MSEIHDGIKYSHIKLSTIIRMAILNLRFKRFRSIITLLGVVIGIGSIYLLLSFGTGLQNLVQNQIVNNKTINTVNIASTNSKIVDLTPDDIGQIKAINHVSSVTGVYTVASKITLGRSSADVVTYGIDDVYLKLTEFSLVAGQMLDTTTSDQAIVNSSLLSLVGIDDSKTAIGKTIQVQITPSGEKPVTAQMRIVGVINSGQAGAEIFLPKDILDKAGVASYAVVKAVVDDRSNIPAVRYQIENMGYTTTSPIDTLDQINQVFRFFNLVLVSLGSIGMIIAALGMINTLTVSLLERTREIALMMVLGARPRDMRYLFVTEAILLSLTGGIIGIILATITSFVINVVLNHLANARGANESFSVFSVSPLLILGVLAMTVVIGFLVSYVPARRAAKINPVEALREE